MVSYLILLVLEKSLQKQNMYRGSNYCHNPSPKSKVQSQKFKVQSQKDLE